MAVDVPEAEEAVVDGEAVEVDAAGDPVVPELALAIREEQAVAVQPQTYLPTPREWEAMTAMAVRLCNTQFVPSLYRGQPDTVLAAIATGREMGIGPMQSLRDIHMIDGRPAFAAQLMLSKMRAGGVVIVESEATSDHARIVARRTDTGEQGTFEFTKADAEAAGLLGKKNWKTWPADMYWARAVGRMARRFGSDLLGGLVYTKEELEDVDDFDGGYGGAGSGYEAEAFDPGKALLPNAVRAETTGEVAAQLNDLQLAMASDLDWKAMLEEAALACIGPRAEWNDDQKDEFMRRWVNTMAKLSELADVSEWYHPELGLQANEGGDALITQAFEFGFGVTPSHPFPKVEKAPLADAVEEATESA